MSNFILQNFEELDRMVRKSIILSKTQKMSKREQRKKIALVLQQILDLKDRVAKLESCLRTLEEDPDQYFQNLNPNNREYIEWKKISLPSEKHQENNSSTEEKKEDRGATAASSGRSAHFGFFLHSLGIFTLLLQQRRPGNHHNPLLHMDTLPLGITLHTHMLPGAVCPFLQWGHYFLHFLKLHSLCLHLLLPLHPLLSLHLDLHPPITLAAFVQIVLINIYVDNLFLLNVI